MAVPSLGNRRLRLCFLRRGTSKVIVLCFFIMFVFTACIQTLVLKDGKTRVPLKKTVYRNLKYFDKSALNYIDTNVIYEEYDDYRKKLKRLIIDQGTPNHYSAIKFYSNGRLCLFSISKRNGFDSIALDPSYEGSRGIYYSNDKVLCYDLFTQIYGDGHFGKISGALAFKMDTLLDIRDFRKDRIRYFIKRKISPEYLKFKSTW